MRLFIAVNFTNEEKDVLMSDIALLKSKADSGRFTQRNNLHLTLVFLGEVSAKRLNDIKGVMSEIKESRFTMEIGGLGRFRRGGEDIYWLGVKPSEELTKVHDALYDGLATKGFALESRAFSPHLTLGRQVVMDEAAESRLSMTGIRPKVTKISLMLSERLSGKLTYTELYAVTLK